MDGLFISLMAESFQPLPSTSRELLSLFTPSWFQLSWSLKLSYPKISDIHLWFFFLKVWKNYNSSVEEPLIQTDLFFLLYNEGLWFLQWVKFPAFVRGCKTEETTPNVFFSPHKCIQGNSPLTCRGMWDTIRCGFTAQGSMTGSPYPRLCGSW